VGGITKVERMYPERPNLSGILGGGRRLGGRGGEEEKRN